MSTLKYSIKGTQRLRKKEECSSSINNVVLRACPSSYISKFYQDEKNQLLTANVWLNLVSLQQILSRAGPFGFWFAACSRQADQSWQPEPSGPAGCWRRVLVSTHIWNSRRQHSYNMNYYYYICPIIWLSRAILCSP